MTNTNYIKGRNKEYKIVKLLKSQNYDIVQRSAGSHSPVDVWAVDTKNKKILLIQAKPTNFRNSQKDLILKKHGDLNGEYEVSFEVR